MSKGINGQLINELRDLENLVFSGATFTRINKRLLDLMQTYKLNVDQGAFYIREYDPSSGYYMESGDERIKQSFLHQILVCGVDSLVLRQDWKKAQRLLVKYRDAIGISSIGRYCVMLHYGAKIKKIDSRLLSPLVFNRLESHLKLVNSPRNKMLSLLRGLLEEKGSIKLGAISLDINTVDYLKKHDLPCDTKTLLTIGDRAFDKMFSSDGDWLCNLMKSSSRWKERRVTNKHYEAGIFNYNCWTPDRDRRSFPDDHPFSDKKDKFPVLKATSSNTFSYIVSQSGVNRFFQNVIRKGLDLPLVGEGWVTETRIFRLLCQVFGERAVAREYSPKWLGRQRFDFYIKDHRLAVEWNGEQHYRAVDYFGGEEAFRATVRRDKKKAERCKKNNVTLLELPYTMTDDEVIESLKSITEGKFNKKIA